MAGGGRPSGMSGKHYGDRFSEPIYSGDRPVSIALPDLSSVDLGRAPFWTSRGRFGELSDIVSFRTVHHARGRPVRLSYTAGKFELITAVYCGVLADQYGIC